MGEIVLAAKITHVPSIWLSETQPKFQGIRQNAIDGLVELGRRARVRSVDCFVIVDCHWITNQGFHVNGTPRFEGRFTSPELPHFLTDMEFSYVGNQGLAESMAATAELAGFRALSHQDPNLSLQYGTLIPMRHMNPEATIPVVPVAANQFASIDEGRRMGEAMAKAISSSPHRVGLLASGSLSHAFWPNALSEAGLDKINGEFNRQVDLRVLELWRKGRIKEFLEMLPDYARLCQGECGMIDTAMLFGALGWDSYPGRGELIGEFFGSTGTGQANVDFSL